MRQHRIVSITFTKRSIFMETQEMSHNARPQGQGPGTAKSHSCRNSFAGNGTPRSPYVNEQTEEPAYEYRRLPTGNHFRLLKLLPSEKFDDDVVCHMRVCDLDSPKCPTYTAISYTWGHGAADATISIIDDDKSKDWAADRVERLDVQDNVLDILGFLRQRGTSRWIWIDALCIDQGSTEERNHQVQLMGRLYRESNRVIAWLNGDRSEDSHTKTVELAFGILQARHQLDKGQRKTWKELFEFTAGKTKLGLVADFCRLRYWSRKWIIQELVEAKSVTLQCEDQTMSMGLLEEYFEELSKTFPLALENVVMGRWGPKSGADLMGTPVARLSLHRAARRQDGKQIDSLHKLLARYKDHKCAEPLDHVYALYNMIGDHRSHLAIDYTQPVLELFYSTMTFLKAHDKVSSLLWPSTATILMRLLRLSIDDVMQGKSPSYQPTAKIVVGMQWQSRQRPLRHAEESKQSEELRLVYRPLSQMAKLSLEKGAISLYQTDSPFTWEPIRDEETVGPQDFAHFRVGSTLLYGFASCRMQPSYELWQAEGTKLDFIVRMADDDHVEFVGRAYTYMSTASGPYAALNPSPARISMTMDESVVLGHWADGLDMVDSRKRQGFPGGF